MSPKPAGRPSLTPIIKWSGGKRAELPILKPAFPKGITRVIEPFAGGGAVSFDLNADTTVLNDISADLIGFYRNVADGASLAGPCRQLQKVRAKIKNYVALLSDKQIEAMIHEADHGGGWLARVGPGWLNGLPVALTAAALQDMRDGLASKAGERIGYIESLAGRAFSADERRPHIETALHGGLYTALRRSYNGHLDLGSEAWRLAAWYSVRCLCYGGMFRYNNDGVFNVPYGGIGYNSRNLSDAADQLVRSDVVDFLKRTSLHLGDFETMLQALGPLGPKDFLFVDPPYDSSFSKYNSDGDFSADDQARLAAALQSISAPWMVVVKNTPLMLKLYSGKGMFRAVFGKTYQVNIRGRFDRAVEHLMVTNYRLKPSMLGVGVSTIK